MENHSFKQVYSIPEAMDATGLGRSTIYKAIQGGGLIAKKVGSRTIITTQALSDWLNNLPEKSKKGGL